ncbi:MAG: precorrin-3B C(17)-methyltransferase [Desulfovibrio sp.]|nr:precorrin-3B C(17)-methyltransferase [Desulfovibrio sp.]
MSVASLHVVGLGPGSADCLTPQARRVLEGAGCVVGYHRYISLVPAELLNGRQCLSTGMRQERERCETAVSMAVSGVPTALVCSGDPGIYALAGLTLETLEARHLVGKIPFDVVPGVPAVCAAAALLGAPLTHDFACISLSDLLTPWRVILQRCKAALEADFTCVLYNPRSRGRPDHLAEVLQLAARYRSPHCPVGLVRQAFRPEQEVGVYPLQNFDVSKVDMLSLCLVGNTESRVVGPYMLTPRGYERKKDVSAAYRSGHAEDAE